MIELFDRDGGLITAEQEYHAHLVGDCDPADEENTTLWHVMVACCPDPTSGAAPHVLAEHTTTPVTAVRVAPTRWIEAPSVEAEVAERGWKPYGEEITGLHQQTERVLAEFGYALAGPWRHQYHEERATVRVVPLHQPQPPVCDEQALADPLAQARERFELSQAWDRAVHAYQSSVQDEIVAELAQTFTGPQGRGAIARQLGISVQEVADREAAHHQRQARRVPLVDLGR